MNSVCSETERLLAVKKGEHGTDALADGESELIIVKENFPGLITIPYGRRNYYGLLLTKKPLRMLFGIRNFASSGNSLLMINPRTAFSCEIKAGHGELITCLVPESYFGKEAPFSSYAGFRREGSPVLSLTENDFDGIEAALEGLVAASETGFEHKAEFVQNRLLELLFELIKRYPANEERPAPLNSAEKIADKFMKLLDQQFPVSPGSPKVFLRQPADYATLLFITTNHLNKALKKSTGKGTSAMIAARTVEESQVMLHDPETELTEVARCMGFTHVQHFISFFRRHTGRTPGVFRKQHGAVCPRN